MRRGGKTGDERKGKERKHKVKSGEKTKKENR